MRPGVTSVILFFNKPALTLRCADAISQAEKPAGHKTIFVDNGSTIDSYNPVHEAHPDAQFVRLTPNQGFGRGMNAGLKASFAEPTTDLVVTLSNDVEVDPGFYTALTRAAKAFSGPVIFCPRVFHLMDKSKPAYTHGRLDVGTATLSHHDDPGLATIRFPDYYPAAAMVWTRKAFEATRGFNERYYCYWEDVELAYRCSLRGVELKPLSSLKIHHLGRGTTGGKAAYVSAFEEGRRLTLEIIGEKR